jgi:hypothetical protein
VKAPTPANAAAPATKPVKPVADRSFWVSKPPRGIK